MFDLLPLLAAIAFSTATAPPHPGPVPTASASAGRRAPGLDPLLSKRALRRARLLIELRMYELRDSRLACVRAAILRRLPADLRPHEPPLHCLEADSPPE